MKYYLTIWFLKITSHQQRRFLRQLASFFFSPMQIYIEQIIIVYWTEKNVDRFMKTYIVRL